MLTKDGRKVSNSKEKPMGVEQIDNLIGNFFMSYAL